MGIHVNLEMDGDGRFELSIAISITIHNGGYGLGDGSRPPQCHRRVAMTGGYPSGFSNQPAIGHYWLVVLTTLKHMKVNGW